MADENKTTDAAPEPNPIEAPAQNDPLGLKDLWNTLKFVFGKKKK
jgi:hypothetical protein